MNRAPHTFILTGPTSSGAGPVRRAPRLFSFPPGMCCSALTTAENVLLRFPSFRQTGKAGLSLSLSILSKPVVSFPRRGERTSEDRPFFFPTKVQLRTLRGLSTFLDSQPQVDRLLLSIRGYFPYLPKCQAFQLEKKTLSFGLPQSIPTTALACSWVCMLFRFTYVLCLGHLVMSLHASGLAIQGLHNFPVQYIVQSQPLQLPVLSPMVHYHQLSILISGRVQCNFQVGDFIVHSLFQVICKDVFKKKNTKKLSHPTLSLLNHTFKIS